jgi:hypothetical protein
VEVIRKSIEGREKNLSPSLLHYIDPMREDDPATFKALLDGLKTVTPTESMMFGTAVHAYMLERDTVVNVGDTAYPADALKEFIDSIIRAQFNQGFDGEPAETLVGMEESITEQIKAKGIKYGNYKPDTLAAFITKTYDAYYKMQVQYWGKDVVLINTKEQSLVSAAASWFESDPTFKKIFYGEQSWTEQYVKVDTGLVRPLAGIIDRAVYNEEEKTLYVTDLKLSSLAPKDFIKTFDRKGLQFGFYTIPEFQAALLAKLGLPGDTKVKHYIAYYSRSKQIGCVFPLRESALNNWKIEVYKLLDLVADHVAENYWGGPLWLRNFEGF